MTEGSHRSKVEIEGKVTSLARSMREANRRIDELSKALEKAQRSAGGASEKLDDTEKKSKKLGDALKGAADKIAAAVAGFTAVAVAADRASQRHIKVTAVMDNLRVSIDKARFSTRGLVGDYDLARLANQAVLLGIVKTDKEFAQLAGSAVKLGRSVGQDAVSSIESLEAALGRGSTEMLDNLGISLKIADAQAQYARQLGKLTSELTEVEKKEAFRVVGMQKVIEASREMNDVTSESAESIQRAKVALENLADDGLAAFFEEWDRLQGLLRDDSLIRELAGGGVELNEELTLAERNTATFNIAMAEARKRVEEAAAAADPLVIAMQQVANDAQHLADSAIIVQKLLQLSAHEQAKNEKVLEGYRRKRAADAKRFHRERMKQLKEQFEQMVINAKQGAQMERMGQLMDRAGSVQRGRSEARLAAADTGTLQPSEADFASFKRSRQDFADAALEIEREKNDNFLNERLRALEAEQEAGVNPIDLIEREKNVRLAHNDFLLENAATETERLQQLDQRRQIFHDAELARIAAERAAHQKRLEMVVQWSGASSQILNDHVGIAMLAADAEIKGEERRAKFMNRAKGIMALGRAAFETVEAAAAFARYDYVAGAMHASAAALGYTQGALLLSGRIDQRAGPGAGASSGGGSSGAANGPSVGGGRREEGLAGQINSDVPPSPNPSAPATASNGPAGQRGGTVNFNGPVHLYGTPEGQFVDSMALALDQRQYNRRRAS